MAYPTPSAQWDFENNLEATPSNPAFDLEDGRNPVGVPSYVEGTYRSTAYKSSGNYYFTPQNIQSTVFGSITSMSCSAKFASGESGTLIANHYSARIPATNQGLWLNAALDAGSATGLLVTLWAAVDGTPFVADSNGHYNNIPNRLFCRTPSNIVFPNTWYTFTAIANETTGEMRLFINGILAASVVSSIVTPVLLNKAAGVDSWIRGSIFGYTDNVEMNALHGSGKYTIDNLKLWNQEITAEDAWDIYDETVPPYTSSPLGNTYYGTTLENLNPIHSFRCDDDDNPDNVTGFEGKRTPGQAGGNTAFGSIPYNNGTFPNTSLTWQDVPIQGYYVMPFVSYSLGNKSAMTFVVSIKNVTEGNTTPLTMFDMTERDYSESLLLVQINQGKLQVGAKAAAGDTLQVMQSSQTINDGDSHLLIFTVDFAANTISMNVDSAPQEVLPVTFSANQMSDLVENFTMGGLSEFSNSNKYIGSMDDLGIFDVVLSGTDKADLYTAWIDAAPPPPPVPPPTPGKRELWAGTSTTSSQGKCLSVGTLLDTETSCPV